MKNNVKKHFYDRSLELTLLRLKERTRPDDVKSANLKNSNAVWRFSFSLFLFFSFYF